jgi:hypothetical protein
LINHAEASIQKYSEQRKFHFLSRKYCLFQVEQGRKERINVEQRNKKKEVGGKTRDIKDESKL